MKNDKFDEYCSDYPATIKLSKEDADRMLECLENPEPPNKNLISAARRHRQLKESGKLIVKEITDE